MLLETYVDSFPLFRAIYSITETQFVCNWIRNRICNYRCDQFRASRVRVLEWQTARKKSIRIPKFPRTANSDPSVPWFFSVLVEMLSWILQPRRSAYRSRSGLNAGIQFSPSTATAELTSYSAYPKTLHFQSLFLVGSPTLYLVSSLHLPVGPPSIIFEHSRICCLLIMSLTSTPPPPNSWFKKVKLNVFNCCSSR
jgi:hypothetical protein